MAFTERFISSKPVWNVAGRQLKRYHLNERDEEIETSIQDAAHAFVASLVPEPDGETPASGFCVLHRSSQGAYLDTFSWVWGNVIECHSAAAGVPFLGCPDGDPTHFRPLDRPWIGCVWELAPFEHERSAWVRHVCTPGAPDLNAYLLDNYPDGACGGAR